MINLLVEIKNEYLIHIINIISPFIMQGIQGIYNDSLEHITSQNIPDTDIFKIFQIYLKGIINWSHDTIEKETNRIINNSQKYNNNIVLSDLLKATIKSHIVILMFDPSLQEQAPINKKLYNIKLCDFIHKIYIECAIEFWNNPYLFYHDYPSIEIKRNYKDCIIIIKECIKESIRKILPLKYILEYYLHENISLDNELTNKIGKQLSENENMYLSKLINKDLYNTVDSNNSNNKSLLELSNKLLEYNSNNTTFKNKKKCNLSPNNTLHIKQDSISDILSDIILDTSSDSSIINNDLNKKVNNNEKNNILIYDQKNQQFDEQLSEQLSQQFNEHLDYAINSQHLNRKNVTNAQIKCKQNKEIKKKSISKQIDDEQQGNNKRKQNKKNEQNNKNLDNPTIFDILSSFQSDDDQINNEENIKEIDKRNVQINDEEIYKRKQNRRHEQINEQINDKEEINRIKQNRRNELINDKEKIDKRKQKKRNEQISENPSNPNIFDILSSLQNDDYQINDDQNKRNEQQISKNPSNPNIFDILSSLQNDDGQINDDQNKRNEQQISKNPSNPNIFDILSSLQNDDGQINDDQNKRNEQQISKNPSNPNIFDILSNLQNGDDQINDKWNKEEIDKRKQNKRNEQINDKEEINRRKQNKRNKQINDEEELNRRNQNKRNPTIVDILSSLQEHDNKEEIDKRKQNDNNKQINISSNLQLNDQINIDKFHKKKCGPIDNDTIDHVKQNINHVHDTSEKQSKKLQPRLKCNNKNKDVLSDKIKGILHKMENISDTILSDAPLNYQDIFSNSD